MKWFKPKKDKGFKVGSFFVIDKGGFGGDYLVLIEIDNLNLKFLVLPDLEKRVIEVDVFNRGVELKVVKFIEVLPNSVFKTCKLQYEKINTSYELCKTDKNN